MLEFNDYINDCYDKLFALPVHIVLNDECNMSLVIEINDFKIDDLTGNKTHILLCGDGGEILDYVFVKIEYDQNEESFICETENGIKVIFAVNN